MSGICLRCGTFDDMYHLVIYLKIHRLVFEDLGEDGLNVGRTEPCVDPCLEIHILSLENEGITMRIFQNFQCSFHCHVPEVDRNRLSVHGKSRNKENEQKRDEVPAHHTPDTAK